MSITKIAFIVGFFAFMFYTFDIMNKISIDIKYIKNKVDKL
jgi:type IV secretory pathway TrbL component